MNKRIPFVDFKSQNNLIKDALTLGIRALGFPSGSEIIVPVNTFIASALAVSANNLKPVQAIIKDKING